MVIEVSNRRKCVMRFLTFHIVIRLSETFQWFDFISIQYVNGIMRTGLLIVCPIFQFHFDFVRLRIEMFCVIIFVYFDCVSCDLDNFVIS